jgi:uncharacterized protein (DUF58 family)
MRVRITFWCIVLVLLGGVIGAILTRSSIYFRIIYLSTLLIIVSFVWAELSVRRIVIKRSTRGERQHFGSVFEEQFEVENLTPLSRTWLEVKDASNLPGSSTTRILSWIKGHSMRNFSGYSLLNKRGEYTLSPTLLHSSDPFGMFEFEQEVVSKNTLLVLPYLVDLKTFPFPVGSLPGGLATRRRTPEVSPPRVSGIREYSPGDALNRIHWPTTARKDKLMVKEFEQDPQADIWIFLDAQKEVHIEDTKDESAVRPDRAPLWWLQQLHPVKFTLPANTFEYAASIAASIAKYFSRSGQVVGFASVGQIKVILSAERGERQLNKILESLALLDCNGDMPIMALVQSQATRIPKGSTVIIITPTTYGKVVDTSAALIQRGMSPFLILIDPKSFGTYQTMENVYSKLTKWKIPYVVIQKGDDIKTKLETGFENTGVWARK